MTTIRKLVSLPLAEPRDAVCGYLLDYAHLAKIQAQLEERGSVVQIFDIHDVLCHIMDLETQEGAA